MCWQRGHGKGDWARWTSARSLRTIIAATAAKQSKRSVLDLLEDETEKAIDSE
jgi:hypothetical protein